MNLWKVQIVFVILLSLSQLAKAQIAMAVAKEEKYPYNSLEWRVEWGCGNYSEASNEAVKYLESKGFKKVYQQLIVDTLRHFDKGYWIVIKTQYESDGKIKIRYGLGVSASSFSVAEANAILNLKGEDWSWKSSIGYTIEQTGFFSNVAQKQLIYIIKKRETSCGESAYDFSYMFGNFDNSLYMKIKNGLLKQNNNSNVGTCQVGHIVNKIAFVGILKSKQLCQDGKVKYSYKIVEAGSREEILKLAPYNTETISPDGQTNYFVYHIVDFGKDKESSILREDFLLFEKLLGIDNKGIINDWANSGIRD